MYFMEMKLKVITIKLILMWLVTVVLAEPVVLTGSMVKDLCGTPLTSIRICSSNLEAIPFQIDELTQSGFYVCPQGVEQNADSSNGILDTWDEIAFLTEDCPSENSDSIIRSGSFIYYPVRLGTENNFKTIYITNDSTIRYSTVRYLSYNHDKQLVETPFYYAKFGKDRFHFTSAGLFDSEKKGYYNLTGTLSITIFLKALWGLIPIRYTEENMYCFVNRYKVGPVRLIRGGNFHLKLGMGLKGSHAYVNQICYPQLVKVPTQVHVPIRFRALFSEAYIEMIPLLNHLKAFDFTISEVNYTKNLFDLSHVDTVINYNPNNGHMVVTNGKSGYVWKLETNINDSLLNGSGFVVRQPSKRETANIDCGYKLIIKDLPKGYYTITNWILFSNKEPVLTSLSSVIEMDINTYCGKFKNRISENHGLKKKATR
jgi:hypothetical protein